MNDKANIQSLTQKLASAHGLTKDEAESFVREFFSLVSDALDKDRMVKVKGLGTFRVIDVEDRDSVDVNTGERITISGHKKVTFTPDASLKEEVNKPFADFETTILVDDPAEEEAPLAANVEDDHLSTIHELYGKPVVAPEPEQAVIEVAPETVQDTDVQDAKTIETEPVEEAQEAGETLEQNQETPEEVSESSSMMEEAQEKESLVSSEDEEPEVVQPSEEVQEEPEPELQEPDSSEPESEAETASETASSETAEADTEGENQPAVAPVADKTRHHHRHHSHHRHHEKKSNTALKWASIIFLILIMGIGAFVLDMYYPGIFREAGFNSYDEPVLKQEITNQIPDVKEAQADAIPDKPESSQTALETSKPETQIKTETVKVEPGESQAKASTNAQTAQPAAAQTSAVQPASPSTTQKLTEGKSYVIDGTLATHTIKSGETLRIISEKYYGSRSFSAKIVEHNKNVIKNPDNVPAGTRINIPRLVEK